LTAGAKFLRQRAVGGGAAPADLPRRRMRQHRGMTDLEAIADRYYCHLLEMQTDAVAYHAALDLYLERHPEMLEDFREDKYPTRVDAYVIMPDGRDLERR